MIWAVILAAGESLRMGTQKLLLPYGETTVIEAIVRTALDSSVDGTLVVLGADKEKVRKTLKSYPVSFAINTDFRRGMLSSIQAGFETLPGEAGAAVLMLGDQPAVPFDVVDGLVSQYRKNGRGIVIPVYGGRRGHPILIETAYRSEILGLDPEVGLKQLIRAHPRDISEVEVSSPAVLKDMDNPEDYAAVTGKNRE
ncbi:MAG: nucleotidyltransferase family protein [Candidatus Aminicenantales bacterium]